YFFQAEDGIRDRNVTGVQTCALPIYTYKEMEKIRGKKISMVFQDPMTALNPTIKIGKQVMEGLTKHQKINKKDARKRAQQLLELVGIPNAEARMNGYAHEFSGGMRQRVVIA